MQQLNMFQQAQDMPLFQVAAEAKATMFYISRVNLGDRVVERINCGRNIEEVKATVARINCGTVEAIRQATVSEAALIEAGHIVTFIRQPGINP